MDLKSGLIRGVTFGGCGFIRGGLLFLSRNLKKGHNSENISMQIFLKYANDINQVQCMSYDKVIQLEQYWE
jgi:hypothetical protein